MSQLRVGDKVVRKAEHRSKNGWELSGDAVTVFRVDSNSIDVGDGNGCFWDMKWFDLLPAEMTVSNETQLPGIPDGYRAVRIGAPEKGEWFVQGAGTAKMSDGGYLSTCYTILEKITPLEPPKPKTRSVVLNRYLVWEGDTPCSHRVIVAEEGYVTDNWQNFTLLGHTETIEVEV